ncbi:hypothetical protein NDU88_002266 [Pleurodeles waltl]|uniref:Uncharacterized protein n=1 Tax=Pleurodeles waltl TaxID=8319 RepID=A0AAV7REY9_PLEWA|nr:hypothetical protein NDU88_002266 [Pleurodeles waltl]
MECTPQALQDEWQGIGFWFDEGRGDPWEAKGKTGIAMAHIRSAACRGEKVGVVGGRMSAIARPDLEWSDEEGELTPLGGVKVPSSSDVADSGEHRVAQNPLSEETALHRVSGLTAAWDPESSTSRRFGVALQRGPVEHHGAFVLSCMVGQKCMVSGEGLSGYGMAPQASLTVNPMWGLCGATRCGVCSLTDKPYVQPCHLGQAAQHGIICGLKYEVLVKDVELDSEEDSLEEGEIAEVAGPSSAKVGEKGGQLMGGLGNLIVLTVLFFRDNDKDGDQYGASEGSHTGQAASFGADTDLEAR